MNREEIERFLQLIPKDDKDEFSQLYDFYENQILNFVSLPPPESSPIRRLRMATLALRQICFDRSKHLFNASIEAFLSNNPYAMTTLMRSHLESTALLGRITKLVTRASKESSAYEEISDSLMNHLMGSRREELNAKGAPLTLNILSMIDQADAILKNTMFAEEVEKPSIIRDSYDFLCEFAHPNFHSHSLAIDFDSTTGSMDFRDQDSLGDREAELISYLSSSSSLFQYFHNEILNILPSEQ